MLYPYWMLRVKPACILYRLVFFMLRINVSNIKKGNSHRTETFLFLSHCYWPPGPNRPKWNLCWAGVRLGFEFWNSCGIGVQIRLLALGTWIQLAYPIYLLKNVYMYCLMHSICCISYYKLCMHFQNSMPLKTKQLQKYGVPNSTLNLLVSEFTIWASLGQVCLGFILVEVGLGFIYISSQRLELIDQFASLTRRLFSIFLLLWFAWTLSEMELWTQQKFSCR